MPSYDLIVTLDMRVEAPSAVLAGIKAIDEVRRAWDGEDSADGTVAEVLNIRASSKSIKPTHPEREGV